MKVLTDKQKNDVLMCALVAALKQSLNCEEAVAVEAAVLLFILTRQAMFPEASHEQANPTR